LKLVTILALAVRAQSPSVRGRGLKLLGAREGALALLSPSVRGRGLKPSMTGAYHSGVSRPPCGGVD